VIAGGKCSRQQMSHEAPHGASFPMRDPHHLEIETVNSNRARAPSPRPASARISIVVTLTQDIVRRQMATTKRKRGVERFRKGLRVK
jgi:hypothetical protein